MYLILNDEYMCASMYEYGYVYVNTGAQGGQKNAPEPKLQVSVCCLM